MAQISISDDRYRAIAEYAAAHSKTPEEIIDGWLAERQEEEFFQAIRQPDTKAVNRSI